jgi:SnoaL-like protein
VNERALADAVLEAFSTSDLAAVERLVAPSATVWGTDDGEHWDDRAGLIAALDGMRDLQLTARWRDPPETGHGWAAGIALYRAGDGPAVETRVTMAFEAGRLVHAHFSFPAITD